MSDSLWPHGLQHTRLPCPSSTPGACSNSGPLSRWCHPTVSSSVVSFSSCLQSFPASGSFLMSHLFASGGQNIGAPASASVLLMNIQDWFPLGLSGLISLQSKGLSRVFSNTSLKSMNFECLSFFPFKMAVEWRWFASFRGHDQESVINLLGTHLITINCIPSVANREEATKLFRTGKRSHSLSIFICTFSGAGWRREFYLTFSYFQRETLVLLRITCQVSMVHWSLMMRNNSRIGCPGILHVRIEASGPLLGNIALPFWNAEPKEALWPQIVIHSKQRMNLSPLFPQEDYILIQILF